MDNCPQCGASYAMVGRVHRCVPKTPSESFKAGPTGVFKSYRYRDPEKRRAQVAKAMRGYRQRKKVSAG